MTYQEIYDILAQTGLPMALHHWEHPPKPPYGVYYDDYTDNFAADNIAYHTIQHVWVELYAPRRSREAEEKIEAALTGAGLYWDRSSDYIESERLWRTRYEMEV